MLSPLKELIGTGKNLICFTRRAGYVETIFGRKC